MKVLFLIVAILIMAINVDITHARRSRGLQVGSDSSSNNNPNPSPAEVLMGSEAPSIPSEKPTMSPSPKESNVAYSEAPSIPSEKPTMRPVAADISVSEAPSIPSEKPTKQPSNNANKEKDDSNSDNSNTNTGNGNSPTAMPSDMSVFSKDGTKMYGISLTKIYIILALIIAGFTLVYYFRFFGLSGRSQQQLGYSPVSTREPRDTEMSSNNATNMNRMKIAHK